MFVKVYGVLSSAKSIRKNISKNISKNLSGKFSHKLLHHAKKSEADAPRTASKREK